jgi:hypothetical protein
VAVVSRCFSTPTLCYTNLISSSFRMQTATQNIYSAQVVTKCSASSCVTGNREFCLPPDICLKRRLQVHVSVALLQIRAISKVTTIFRLNDINGEIASFCLYCGCKTSCSTLTIPWLLVRKRTIPTERPPLVGKF